MGIRHRFASSPSITLTSWGTSPASAMVVLRTANLIKRYRKYKIKTVEGPDDYASMREVIVVVIVVKRDGLTPPDRHYIGWWSRSGQCQAKDVFRNELNFIYPSCRLQKNDKHQTNELLFEILRVIDLPRAIRGVFPPSPYSRMKFTALPSPSIDKSVVRTVQFQT